MFAFTDKPQGLLELVTHGLNLFRISLKSSWYWSLLISLLATLYPLYFMKIFEDAFMGFTHSHRLAVTLGWMILAPILVFLAGMLIRRIYVAGARVKENIAKSAGFVGRKVITLYLAMIFIAFLTTIGFYMAFIPGLFVAVLFIFVAPIIVIDQETFWSSFKISAYLVWGNWWRIFVIIIIPLVFTAVITTYTLKLPLLIATVLQFVEMLFIVPLFYSLVLNGFSDAKLRHKMKPLKTQSQAAKAG